MNPQQQTLAWLLTLLAAAALFHSREQGGEVPLDAPWTAVTLDDIEPVSLDDMPPIEVNDPDRLARLTAFLRNHRRGWKKYPPDGAFQGAVSPTHQLLLRSSDGRRLSLDLVRGGTTLLRRSRSGVIYRDLLDAERDELLSYFERKWSDEKFELVRNH